MTVFAKDITYGLETAVKEIQQYLDDNLPWSGTLNIYGIVHKKIRDDIIIPEAYKGTGIGNKEYTEVFIDDKGAASIGFNVIDRSTLPFKSANIDIIFTVLIDKIYSTTTRDTEKALIEAEKVLIKNGRIYDILDIKIGIDEVFAGFDTERIKHRDMHPWFVFALNVDIPYDDNNIC